MTTAEIATVERDGVLLEGQAQEIQVRDAATYQQAGVFLRTVAAYVKRVGEVLDPIVNAAHSAHKVAVGQREKLLAPARDAEKLVKGEMAKYDTAERERVLREQRAAEQERRRLEDEERLRNAARLEAQGKEKEAEQALTAPVEVPIFTPPVVAAPKAEGISSREKWTADVVNLTLLVRAVADGKAPISLVQADQKVLDAMARALKQEMRVPGVEARCERVMAVRA